jgi:hypothetical protein
MLLTSRTWEALTEVYSGDSSRKDDGDFISRTMTARAA